MGSQMNKSSCAVSLHSWIGGLLLRAGAAGARVTFVVALLAPTASLADENGVSFWLPGQFSSLAAAPLVPGWAWAAVGYYTNVSASGAVAAEREISVGRFNPIVNVNLNVNLNANAELALVQPSYVFASPVFGGQLQLGVTSIMGRNSTDLNGTLTAMLGPLTVTRQGTLGDSIAGFGDLYPIATLRWNNGVNNFMTYVTGDIPVGAYDPTRLANLGIGHGAIDGGLGYTYLDPQTGHEFSVVTGLTGNFTNPSTGYTNGVDWHLDWGASQFLSKQLHVGLVGYVYNQLTPDSGCAPTLCPFESRVVGVGPQIGYIFPVGTMQGYLNLKGYGEFDSVNRPSGGSVWLTFSLSPAPPAAVSPAPIVTKAPRS